jgi:hypothetical protein
MDHISIHWHSCYGCGSKTRCEIYSCRLGDTESCELCCRPSLYCGHCGGNSISGHDSDCYSFSSELEEVTLEQVLGKDRVAGYLEAMAKVKESVVDLSRYLDLGDSWRAHSLGVLLN